MRTLICAVIIMLFAAVPSQSSETVLGIGGNEVSLLGANTIGDGDASQFNATGTTYGASSCTRLNRITSPDGSGLYVGTCAQVDAAVFVNRSFLLTRFVISTRSAIASDSTASCVFRLIDLDDAEIPGSEVSITPLTAEATGKVFSSNLNHLMSAGNTSSGLPDLNISFFGVWQ